MPDAEFIEVDFEPDESEIGERVDAVVARRAGIARAPVQEALAAGALTVRDAPSKPSRRLETGDRVRGRLRTPGPVRPQPEDIAIDIRYEDERVLVVSKPPGLVTHPAGGHEAGTLVNALLGLGVRLGAAASARPGIVHRLDKDTSGVVLVAKDDAALAQLQAKLKERAVERTYLAAVRGIPSARSGTIEAPIARHPRRRTLMAVVPSGRPAVTHYLVLDAGPEAALLQVRLETGRTHQIRVHLAYIGHPVIGDTVYGGGTGPAGAARPFLHAARLVFPHPDDDRPIEVDDPLPDDLAAALDPLGLALPE